LQNPQNALETSPVRCPRSASVVPPSPGRGNIAPTNSRCSSVNSLCRLFMTEAHQRTRLIHKWLT
jgi:hypothetical protein